MISGPPPRGKPGGYQARGDLGPIEYSEHDDTDRRLLAAREAFPDMDIYRVAYGYLAVPGGTPVYSAADPDTLIAKRRTSLTARSADDPGAAAPDGPGAS